MMCLMNTQVLICVSYSVIVYFGAANGDADLFQTQTHYYELGIQIQHMHEKLHTYCPNVFQTPDGALEAIIGRRRSLNTSLDLKIELAEKTLIQLVLKFDNCTSTTTVMTSTEISKPSTQQATNASLTSPETTLLYTTTNKPNRKKCPSNYMYNATLLLCWRFINSPKKTWQNATEQCKLEGGNLMNFNTMTEFRVIQPYLKSVAAYNVFVGASDLKEEGKFKWGNGNPVEQAMWHPGDPDGGSSQNCVAMYIADNFYLIDTACSLDYEYLCQIILD